MIVVLSTEESPLPSKEIDAFFLQCGAKPLVATNALTEDILYEVDFMQDGDATTVWIDKRRESVGIRGDRDVSLSAALAVQAACKVPLNAVSDAYGYEVPLIEIKEIDTLRDRLRTGA